MSTEHMLVGDKILIDDSLLVFVGAFESDISKYPVECYIDSTNLNSLSVRLELKDYGKVTYPLSNIQSGYLSSELVRKTLRRFEDWVLERQDRLIELTPVENAFYSQWLLSMRG